MGETDRGKLGLVLIGRASGGSEGKASAYSVGDPGLVPELGVSPGEENCNLLQNSCLENPMERGVWWATVHGVSKSWTRLRPWSHRESDMTE